ncbi:MAG: rod shape-determining protein [Deltaproteobacteria bacterium]|jgi:rod shape-determining protein MreB|nr:rod shape-determining protein [Deltaproteobacteria bacterium]
MLKKFFRLFSQDLAMDLGTANTLLYTRKAGIVLNEPSVVAVDAEKGTVLAIGREAKEFLGRTPRRIKAVRPMRDGVIADFDITSRLIAYFIRKVLTGLRLFRPDIVICVPSGITQVEKRAVVESAREAGAGEVNLIEEPMAAALGAGLPVHEPRGSMVIDIGGGTTEVAVISLSALACAESLRVAGDAMNMAVQRYFQDEFRLKIGENMAERIKMVIGSACPLKEPLEAEVGGKDAVSGAPRVIRISDGHIREALAGPVRAIVHAVRLTLEKTPPELSADIARNGILMAGGGSLLKGLSDVLHEDTKLKIALDEDPLTTIVRGVGRTLDDRDFYRRVYIS